MKTRSHATLILLALALTTGRAWGETIHEGTVSSDETWTLAGSPHRIGSSLSVQAKVTIEPGVSVTTGEGSDFIISGAGSVWAVGTPDKPIRFTFMPSYLSVLIDALSPSEFRYCHFSGEREVWVRAPSASPERPSHLFQHCLFQNAFGLSLTHSPTRVLNSTFIVKNTAVRVDLSGSVANEMPTIRHNAMKEGGIGLASYSGSGDCGGEPFIQDNRITGPEGVLISLGEDTSITGLVISDCSLNCPTGINIYYPYWGGASVDLTVQRCDLVSTAYFLDGYAWFSGTFNLTNNYWGSADSAVIDSRVFGGALVESAFTPFATNSFFRQADVDGSASGNATGQEDATLVKEHIVGLRQLSPDQQQTADVDNDGDVDVRDALMIESFVKGTLWRLPVR